MNFNEWMKDYFTFTRKERIALIVVIAIIVAAWLFPKVLPPKSNSTLRDTSWITAAKKLQRKQNTSQPDSAENNENVNDFAFDKPATSHANSSKGELFYFDPNTLPIDGWKKLGIRDKTIATIQNYLNKGGHFYKAEDLKKIYGLHSDDYERFKTYIRIETVAKNSNEFVKEDDLKKENSKPKYPVIEINNADTSAFIALPWIGSKLASRIVNFRDKLGGFYSVDQIGETYGLPDSTFQKIKSFLRLEDPQIKKININTATKDEMKTHPYIRWTLANAIVEYRNQHGNFLSIDDLKKITLVTDDVFNKIKFYLTL
jgi:competence ComEA-like helix-hairpin-helix protein